MLDGEGRQFSIKGERTMSQGFIAQYAAEAALHTEGVSALSKGAITTLKEAFGLEQQGQGVRVSFRGEASDDVIITGMRMMALVGFIMIAAQGFAAVIEATNQVPTLVEASVNWIGDSQALAAFLMLLIGLLITLGIGSSFSTIPILAIIYVPLCIQFGFSPAATIAIIGTAAALGDAGSPASDSTLGPTSGLNMDGQHDHMKDSVIPTFIHFNIPLMIFGWIAAMVL